jgi:hypothetical protein
MTCNEYSISSPVIICLRMRVYRLTEIYPTLPTLTIEYQIVTDTLPYTGGYTGLVH